MAHGHDHVLALDQVFFVVFDKARLDHRPSRGRELLPHLDNFGAENAHQSLTAAQNVEVVENLRSQFLEFVANLVTPQRRQALQAQLKDGPRLLFR